jgi:hypothetical protein
MTIITIPLEIETPLMEAARRQGTTPELLAVDYLRQRFAAEIQRAAPANGAKNLAEYLGDFIGCIDSGENVPGGARMSENIDEKLTAILLENKRQGHL